MPPKKAAEPEKRVLLGRPTNNVKAGLVGMPNVGKSTTFNLMCNMSVAAENFPFCTIDPTEARVEVPDQRFTTLVDKWVPKSVIPAYLQVMDIAGLVKGAASGEGLGNAFLSHISATDAIFHIVRVFEETMDGDVAVHVEDEVDPVRDLEIIAKELRLKDVAAVEKIIEPLAKEVGRDGKAKEKKDRLEITQKVLKVLKEDDKDIRFESWNAKETDVINDMHLLTAKPALYLVNMSEKDFIRKKNKWLAKLKAWLDENRPGEKMIPYSAGLEAKLFEMGSDEERAAYLEEKKLEGVPAPQSQMGKIVREGYHTLQLVHFFTCGHDEVRAWTIREGWKAPQAAGTIHTDFERGFIKAETYNYEDWIAAEMDVEGVKKAGKYKTEGKEYVVKDGDIIFFKFNVTAEKKK